VKSSFYLRTIHAYLYRYLMPPSPIRCCLFRDEMLYPSPECCSRRARWVGSGWPSDEKYFCSISSSRVVVQRVMKKRHKALSRRRRRRQTPRGMLLSLQVTSTGANYPLEGVVVRRSGICVSSPAIVAAAAAAVLYARAGLERPWAARRGAAAGAGERVGLPGTVNAREHGDAAVGTYVGRHQRYRDGRRPDRGAAPQGGDEGT
jgi:hypothetical protein